MIKITSILHSVADKAVEVTLNDCVEIIELEHDKYKIVWDDRRFSIVSFVYRVDYIKEDFKWVVK